MNKHIIASLVFCLFTSSAIADEILLKPDHPDRYTVVKGDTLWAISGKFLNDPWKWPKVWKMNRDQIKNPHWIYPGDVVVVDMSSGQPQLKLLHEEIKLDPSVKVESLEKQAIHSIQPSEIAPFLSQPLVLEKDALKDSPVIIAAEDGRIAINPSMNVYADKIQEGEAIHWQVYRPDQELIDPDTKENLGVEVKYLGEAKIRHYGEPATLEITRVKEEMEFGDRLVKADEALVSSYIPHAPDTDVHGRILKSYTSNFELAKGSVVSLNLGKNKGMEEGHVLAVYSDGETISTRKIKPLKNSDDTGMVKLPNERIGLLMVFRTFDKVSYALILESKKPIHILDFVQTP